MNGVHDMGGMDNLGPLEVERDEPRFHHQWERRAFAITLAAGALGEWNLDMTRFAREQMRGADYLRATYYEKWLFGLERQLVERRLVTRKEVDAYVESFRSAGASCAGCVSSPRATQAAAGGGEVANAPDTLRSNALRASDVDAKLRRGTPVRVDVDVAPRFAPGDAVVTRNDHPAGHTRLPRYARGRRGVIDRDHGVFVFADANATGRGPQPQHLYSVRFASRELWGEGAPAHDSVRIDLWEAHLEHGPMARSESTR